MADYSKTDEVIDDLIRRYANSQNITFTDIVVRFFRGIYSYPDDLGMSLAVTVSGHGLLGPYMQRQALRISYELDMLICVVMRNQRNFWYFLTKYKDYLVANGWLMAAQGASSSGRIIGGMLTNMALARAQAIAGVDPRTVPTWNRWGVRISLFLLAAHGAACHAVLAGEREFLSVLHRMLTGEIDPSVGRIQREIPFDSNAPWMRSIPNNINELTDEVRPWLQDLCAHISSISNPRG
jgi:hypothetical protein